MKWRGPIKPINVELPEDLHLAVKSEAPIRNLSTKAAYVQALERWLGGSVLDSLMKKSPAATSAEEQQWLDRVLTLLRSGNKPVVSFLKNDIVRGELHLKTAQSHNAKQLEGLHKPNPKGLKKLPDEE